MLTPEGHTSPEGAPVYGHCIRRRFLSLHMPKYQRELCIRRILAERDVIDTISGLKNRLRMLCMKCIDVEALIQKRRERKRHHRNMPREFLIFMLVIVGVAGICGLLLVGHLCHLLIIAIDIADDI